MNIRDMLSENDGDFNRMLNTKQPMTPDEVVRFSILACRPGNWIDVPKNASGIKKAPIHGEFHGHPDYPDMPFTALVDNDKRVRVGTDFWTMQEFDDMVRKGQVILSPNQTQGITRYVKNEQIEFHMKFLAEYEKFWQLSEGERKKQWNDLLEQPGPSACIMLMTFVIYSFYELMYCESNKDFKEVAHILKPDPELDRWDILLLMQSIDKIQPTPNAENVRLYMLSEHFSERISISFGILEDLIYTKVVGGSKVDVVSNAAVTETKPESIASLDDLLMSMTF